MEAIINENSIDRKLEIVKQVNQLLNKSFHGPIPFFPIKGNLEYTQGLHWETGMETCDYELKYIGQPGLAVFRVFGKFQNNEGTHLEINPSRLKQAEKYAELFKQKYGKEVTIDISEKSF